MLNKPPISQLDAIAEGVGSFSNYSGMNGKPIHGNGPPHAVEQAFLAKELISQISPKGDWKNSAVTELEKPLSKQNASKKVTISTKGNGLANAAFGSGEVKVSVKTLQKLSDSARIVTSSELVPPQLFLEMQKMNIQAQDKRSLKEVLGTKFNENDYQKYGFSSKEQFNKVADIQLNFLACGVCHSQETHFFTEQHKVGSTSVNKLRDVDLDKATPNVLLSTPGINFAYGGKNGRAEIDDQTAKMLIDNMWRGVLTSAAAQNCEVLSFSAIGLGAFTTPDMRSKHATMYYESLMKMLEEPELKGKFKSIYLNPIGTSAELQKAIASNPDSVVKPFNGDVKFLAVEFAKQNVKCGLLNPSDPDVMWGKYDVGEYYKNGHYVGEEDLAATSTACLGSKGISDVYTNKAKISSVAEIQLAEKILETSIPMSKLLDEKQKKQTQPINQAATTQIVTTQKILPETVKTIFQSAPEGKTYNDPDNRVNVKNAISDILEKKGVPLNERSQISVNYNFDAGYFVEATPNGLSELNKAIKQTQDKNLQAQAQGQVKAEQVSTPQPSLSSQATAPQANNSLLKKWAEDDKSFEEANAQKAQVKAAAEKSANSLVAFSKASPAQIEYRQQGFHPETGAFGPLQSVMFKFNTEKERNDFVASFSNNKVIPQGCQTGQAVDGTHFVNIGVGALSNLSQKIVQAQNAPVTPQVQTQTYALNNEMIRNLYLDANAHDKAFSGTSDKRLTNLVQYALEREGITDRRMAITGYHNGNDGYMVKMTPEAYGKLTQIAKAAQEKEVKKEATIQPPQPQVPTQAPQATQTQYKSFSLQDKWAMDSQMMGAQNLSQAQTKTPHATQAQYKSFSLQDKWAMDSQMMGAQNIPQAQVPTPQTPQFQAPQKPPMPRPIDNDMVRAIYQAAGKEYKGGDSKVISADLTAAVNEILEKQKFNANGAPPVQVNPLHGGQYSVLITPQAFEAVQKAVAPALQQVKEQKAQQEQERKEQAAKEREVAKGVAFEKIGKAENYNEFMSALAEYGKFEHHRQMSPQTLQAIEAKRKEMFEKAAQAKAAAGQPTSPSQPIPAQVTAQAAPKPLPKLPPTMNENKPSSAQTNSPPSLNGALNALLEGKPQVPVSKVNEPKPLPVAPSKMLATASKLADEGNVRGVADLLELSTNTLEMAAKSPHAPKQWMPNKEEGPMIEGIVNRAEQRAPSSEHVGILRKNFESFKESFQKVFKEVKKVTQELGQNLQQKLDSLAQFQPASLSMFNKAVKDLKDQKAQKAQAPLTENAQDKKNSGARLR